MPNVINVCNWSICRKLGGGRDPIIPEGDLNGHPTVLWGSPGMFWSFNVITGVGLAHSGRTYEFDRKSFQPNGFARTVEEAFDWLSIHWLKPL
jgi:hypothetical protein